MFIYVLCLFAAYVWWQIKDFFGDDLLIDYSENSVPLIRTSFNFASKRSGKTETFWRSKFIKTSLFPSTDETFLFFREASTKFRKSFRHSFFGLKAFQICRAREAEMILGSSKHLEKSRIYNLLHPFLKTGLLTSAGEKWHKRRRMLTPTFHFEILKEFFDVFTEEGDKLVTSLKADADKELNVIPVSSQFTLNTICGNFSSFAGKKTKNF